MPDVPSPHGARRGLTAAVGIARPIVLLAAAGLLAGGVGACGSDSESSANENLSPPPLTIPTDHSAEQAAKTTSSTDTTATDTTATDTTAATAAPAATTQTPAATTGGTAGGQAAPTTTPQTTQGNNAGGTPAQQFEEFCKQNPGAC